MSRTTTGRGEVLIMASQVITLNDVESLADRLLARSKSRMFADQPSLQADMLLAARLLARWIQGDTMLGCAFDLDD
jgi:hypothetical protein